jgi:hypothetical protein
MQEVLAQAPGDPESNFEFLWKTFDANYAAFKAKHIDWKALYNVYRPQVTSKTTDDELFAVISKMLGHLNDNHVQFHSRDPQRQYSAGYLWEMFGAEGFQKFREMLGRRPAPDTYFKNALKETGNGIFAYGWLDDRIGYFHFKGFMNREVSARAIDEILGAFKDVDAVVVDVRRNGGGDDQVGAFGGAQLARPHVVQGFLLHVRQGIVDPAARLGRPVAAVGIAHPQVAPAAGGKPTELRLVLQAGQGDAKCVNQFFLALGQAKKM